MQKPLLKAVLFVVINLAIDIPSRLSPPSAGWLLGTDALGRDILSRLLHGARWSLGFAFLISVIGLCVGTLAGLAAARSGGLVDWIVMRTTDTFLAFPDLVTAVVIAGMLGAETEGLIFGLTITGWTRYARGIRAVTANARMCLAGMSPISIARRHYLPSLLPSLTIL
ncbi:ABC transporter permease [Litoreibacter roseus]|uniref:ABC transmembrane type-1 domain-containing protein n=1 Tax=Litoreibacter roseus TaxID=2601869 RepID=A0A6N6JIN2_9RHOB|nr:ABC transporter permease subunit [Litoreibacter roseus]GFE66201.1 hypothetical protein KIN_32750 [Litoreibacter roseus]